jgi:hypothetical protein
MLSRYFHKESPAMAGNTDRCSIRSLIYAELECQIPCYTFCSSHVYYSMQSCRGGGGRAAAHHARRRRSSWAESNSYKIPSPSGIDAFRDIQRSVSSSTPPSPIRGGLGPDPHFGHGVTQQRPSPARGRRRSDINDVQGSGGVQIGPSGHRCGIHLRPDHRRPGEDRYDGELRQYGFWNRGICAGRRTR